MQEPRRINGAVVVEDLCWAKTLQSHWDDTSL